MSGRREGRPGIRWRLKIAGIPGRSVNDSLVRSLVNLGRGDRTRLLTQGCRSEIPSIGDWITRSVEITDDDAITWSAREERIAAEGRLDGVCVIRTSLDPETIGPAAAAYKSLAQLERAIRNLQASRLEIRPIRVCSEDHVRALVFLCVLACHVQWHLRRRLAPLLFEDDDREGARSQRMSPVAPAGVPECVKAKADTKLTSDGLPVNSFTTLLADLAALTLNEAKVPSNSDHHFPVFSQPTPLQSRAFNLLEIEPAKFSRNQTRRG